VKARGNLPRAPIGDPNLVALSQLDYDLHHVRVPILDIARMTVSQLSMKRAELVKAYGHVEPALGWSVPPDGELVALRNGRAGLLLRDGVGIDASRHWYVEVDAATGALGKSASLGTLGAEEHMTFLGTDGVRGAAWFVVQRPSPKGVVIDFMRVDLASLAVTTPHTLKLAPKTSRTGYEDALRFHAARDYARFAVVEYDEIGLGTTPPAQVHFVDASGSFAVPALPTTYGVAFSQDGAHAYLGSSQVGTVVRVDLAARRIDTTTTGIKLLGHLVMSPKGQLVSLATSTSFGVYDPALRTRTDHAHIPDLAPAMAQLFGGAVFTSDGRHLVMPDAIKPPLPSAFPQPDSELVVARIVD
jgi:hypothetical protein